MDETKIHHILMDALKAANAKCESDGSTIWIDIGNRRALAVRVSECPPDDYGVSEEERLHTYSVSLHASFAGSFDVKAANANDAEEMIRAKFHSEDITVRDLELDSTEVNATEID